MKWFKVYGIINKSIRFFYMGININEALKSKHDIYIKYGKLIDLKMEVIE